MKTIASTLFILLCSFCVNAQEIEESFDRIKLKGFTSIVKYYIDIPDSSIWIIDTMGDIIKKEDYTNGKLSSWWIGEYDKNGLLLYEEHHGQIYVYNEAVGDHLPILDDAYYSGKFYKYTSGKLDSISHFSVSDNDIYIDYNIYFQYDKKGRIVKEVYVDTFLGYTGDFKANTSILSKISSKNKIEKYEKIFSYKNDTITSRLIDEGIFTGYNISILGKNKKTIHSYRTDEKGKKLIEYFYNYSKEGNIVEKRTKVWNFEKLNMDMSAGDQEKITYNSKGLPTEFKVFENSKLIYGSVFK
jgi:hypothetical protein